MEDSIQIDSKTSNRNGGLDIFLESSSAFSSL